MYPRATYKAPVDEAFARLTKAHDKRVDYLCKAGVIEARPTVNGAAEKPSLWIRIVSLFR